MEGNSKIRIVRYLIENNSIVNLNTKKRMDHKYKDRNGKTTPILYLLIIFDCYRPIP